MMKMKPCDPRPQRFGWAPGAYLNTCGECKQWFEGDKRASMCADCAYSLPDPAPTPTGGQVESTLEEKVATAYKELGSVGNHHARLVRGLHERGVMLFAENAALREERDAVRKELHQILDREEATSKRLESELARLREENERLVKLQEAWTAINLPREVPVPYSELLLEVHTLRATNAGLVADKERLDEVQSNGWTLQMGSAPNADAGDHSTWWEVVEHHMAKPRERVIGHAPEDNLRAAIDQALDAAKGGEA